MTVPEGFSVKLFAGEPDVNQPVAMGWVETTVDLSPGHVLYAEVRGRRLPMTITPMPFAPHRYVRT